MRRETERGMGTATQLYYNVAAANLHSWGKVFPDFFLEQAKLISHQTWSATERRERPPGQLQRIHHRCARGRRSVCVRENFAGIPKSQFTYPFCCRQTNARTSSCPRPSHNVAPLQFNSQRGEGRGKRLLPDLAFAFSVRIRNLSGRDRVIEWFLQVSFSYSSSLATCCWCCWCCCCGGIMRVIANAATDFSVQFDRWLVGCLTHPTWSPQPEICRSAECF